MPDFWMDVDATLAEVPVNIIALIDDTDFKTRETGIVYDSAGMDLVWNFVTTAGATSQTAVTPTTGGEYDWTHQGDGMYTIEIPASGGASINNDTEGFGWFTGLVTGVLAWRGPTIGFRAAALNNALIDSGDNLDVNITQLGGDTQSATDLKDFADAGYDPATNKVQGVVLVDTTTTNTDMRGTDNAALSATALTNATWTNARAAYLDELAAGNLPTDIADIPTVAQFEARTLPTADYFDPAADQIPIFSDGMVFVDDEDGVASTAWPYGTSTNPTNTIANAKIIADANDLKKIHLYGGFTLAADMIRYSLYGNGNYDTGDILAVAGYSLAASTLKSIIVSGESGNGANVNAQTRYLDCYLLAHTLMNGAFLECAVDGACSLVDVGHGWFRNCHFSMQLAATLTVQAPDNLKIDNPKGSLTLAGMDGGTATIQCDGSFNLTIAASCTGGTLNIYGDANITNSTGGTTVNIVRNPVDMVELGTNEQSAIDLKDFADAGYDPATNKVEGVKLVDTTTTNTDVRGTDNAALSATALTNATWTDARAGALTDWINGGRLDLILDIIAADVVNLDGDAMRGTDSAATAANVLTQTTAALVAIHLDHLLAVNYDPASKPGVATALWNELIESDGGVSRFTANALEEAPTGGSAPTAEEIVDEWETQSQADPTGFHVNVLEVNGTAQTANDNGADINTLVTRITDARMGALTDWINGGRLDLILDIIATDTTTDLPTLINNLENVSIADILTTQMTEAYAGDGVAPTLAQALFLIQQSVGDFSISGTTLTVKKLDGSTTAATYTLDDASDPTSRTRAT